MICTMLYEDTAIYKADSYSLWIDYIDGSYSYSDFSESSGGTILPVKPLYPIRIVFRYL